MYSIKNVFKQEPNAIKAAIVTLLATLVMAGVVNLSGEQVAGYGLALEVLLGLFYVRPLSISKKAIDDLAAGKDPIDVTTTEGGFTTPDFVAAALIFIAGMLITKVFLC